MREFKNDSTFDDLSTEQLRERAEQGSIPERTRALSALARRSSGQPALADVIVQAINDGDNRTSRILGTVSIAHVAFACLWAFGDAYARMLLEACLLKWPEPDRGDLLSFMRSQDIQM